MKNFIEKLLFLFTLILISIALYMVFIYLSIEVKMGVVQKIFYFHLGSAFAGFAGFFIVFINSILYLIYREDKYDIISVSAAELGILFISIVLITGILWAKPIWNVWWTWDPRLTSTFILWLIFIAYLILRANLKDTKQMPLYAAIFGIIGFLDVPIVFMSIRWWRTIHPVIIKKTKINLSPDMLHTLIISVLAVFSLFFLLLYYRIKIEKLKQQRDYLKNILY